MTWPFQAEPAHGQSPSLPYGVPLPKQLTPEAATDYGTPLGVCYQLGSTSTSTASSSDGGGGSSSSSSSSTTTSSSSGVFRRKWTNGWVVEIDCSKRKPNNNNCDSSSDNDDDSCEILEVKSRLVLPEKMKNKNKGRQDRIS